MVPVPDSYRKRQGGIQEVGGKWSNEFSVSWGPLAHARSHLEGVLLDVSLQVDIFLTLRMWFPFISLACLTLKLTPLEGSFCCFHILFLMLWRSLGCVWVGLFLSVWVSLVGCWLWSLVPLRSLPVLHSAAPAQLALAFTLCSHGAGLPSMLTHSFTCSLFFYSWFVSFLSENVYSYIWKTEGRKDPLRWFTRSASPRQSQESGAPCRGSQLTSPTAFCGCTGRKLEKGARSGVSCSAARLWVRKIHFRILFFLSECFFMLSKFYLLCCTIYLSSPVFKYHLHVCTH